MSGLPWYSVEYARVLFQLARWGIGWLRRDTSYPSPVPDNPKFRSPRDAVELIHDGDVLATSGLGGNQRASMLYCAIREVFEATGHPSGLTVVNVGGCGGRGMAPGTLEELGQAGLCTRLITGHFETFRAMLDLAEAGQCELQCIPLGILTLLYDAMAHGRDSLVSANGVGTFIDPRLGAGSPVAGTGSEQLIAVARGGLRYRVPPIDVALFNVPAADRRGNLYVKHAAMIGDSREIALAAKRNGGRVIANVGLLVDEGYDDIFLPADKVDAVVYYPDTEQTPGMFHRDPWLALTTDSDVPVAAGLARAQTINTLARVTARRSAADEVVARLAAATLLSKVRRGANVNIGIGLPEAVARVIFEAGRLDDVHFVLESGVLGGLPAPGIFFGAALSPERIISPAEVFTWCRDALDATCLGALQVDSHGNVNVSKRGAGARNYVGPGGFIDLTEAADTIVFVCAWMARADVRAGVDSLRIEKRGTAKFVAEVDEITFSGARALAAGKRVFYATHVGLFELTERGMMLSGLMPGIDLRHDVLDATAMQIVLPPSGRVPLLPATLFTAGDWAPPARPVKKRPANRRERRASA